MTRLVKLKNTILYGNVWIACGAGLATWQTLHILGLHALRIAWFTTLATFFTYNFQRLVKLNRLDGYADHNRNAWSVRNRRALTLFTAASFVVLLTFIPSLPIGVWPLLIASFAVAVGYVVRFVPHIHPSPKTKKTAKRALRELPYTKLLLIAAIWSFATVLLPILWTDAGLPVASKAALMLERFFFIAALSIPFDIRDAGLDERSQRTLPQVFGLSGARWLAVASVIIAAGFSVWMWLDGWYSNSTAAALFGSYIVAALSVFGSVKVHANGPRPRREPYYSGLLDGLIIVQAVLVLSVG